MLHVFLLMHPIGKTICILLSKQGKTGGNTDDLSDGIDRICWACVGILIKHVGRTWGGLQRQLDKPLVGSAFFTPYFFEVIYTLFHNGTEI